MHVIEAGAGTLQTTNRLRLDMHRFPSWIDLGLVPRLTQREQ